ncbi:LytR family transcriptional regulator [Liquorilactobacillus sucicola DSM 21376 = JCM 15457]|uniref:LytR family transcriptional regulator n=1 Tax=Liquorilactobacillus sucicola DSM 21376 = JCM 15457 TaxID=1423806 RepID=A0A0R2DVI4_9LACO|nr:LytR family transcriptional regulator [Liquorilactobacillus sucicola DSM 21376 = JCM 15457]
MFTVAKDRERLKEENSRRANPPHSKPAFKSRQKTIFFWTLFGLICCLGIGILYVSRIYKNARQATNTIYSPNNVKKKRDTSSLLKSGSPISILLMGTDTGALGRNFKGRTDTLIILTLNPDKEKMTLVSLPRDAKVAVTNYENRYPSKLNSAYDYGGSATAVKTVQKYLNVPIDFYATINMGGLEHMVNAVNGVDISPTLTFSYGGYSFTKNKTVHMSGAEALAYVRMRHTDPQGDYGRQLRQRQVLTQVASNGGKLKNLLSTRFFGEISKQLKTDLSFNDIMLLALKYRTATHHMTSDHAQGNPQMINGVSFESVPEDEKQRVTDLLRSSLDIPKAETGNTLLNSNGSLINTQN